MTEQDQVTLYSIDPKVSKQICTHLGSCSGLLQKECFCNEYIMYSLKTIDETDLDQKNIFIDHMNN